MDEGSCRAAGAHEPFTQLFEREHGEREGDDEEPDDEGESARERGGAFMMSGAGFSAPRPSAGSMSVPRSTARIWMIVSGSGIRKTTNARYFLARRVRPRLYPQEILDVGILPGP